MLDYETLRLIWRGLIGLLFIGFAITDGFDMGWVFCCASWAKTILSGE